MTPTSTTRRLRAAIGPALVLTLVLAGCGAADAGQTPTAPVSATTEATVAATPALSGATDAHQTAADVLAGNQETHDADDDAQWDAADATAIALSGRSATVSGEGAAVNGSTVVVSAPGTYVLSGDYSGQIVVDSAADGRVRLVLDGVDIDTDAGAAIDVQAADEAVVILADGSSNSLADASAYADDASANAALYSAADLTVTGTGSLTVTGRGNDGIASSDGLVIQSGAIAVTAVDDGIRGKDYLVVRDGTITVDAGGDGLKADNEEEAERGYVWIDGGTVDVTSGDDGIDVATDVVTTGGTLSIVAGGGAGGDPESGAKGVSAGVIAVFEGGELAVDAADDTVNTNAYAHLAGATVSLASGDDGVRADLQLVVSAGQNTVTRSVEGLEAGQITISGGETSITASDDGTNVSEPDEGTAEMTMVISGGTLLVDAGGDGLDVNRGTITQTGGTVVVSGPTGSGDGALDADGGMTISGGVLLAAGSAGMSMAPAAGSAQASVQFTLSGTVAAGTVLTVVDSSGSAIASFVTSKQTQSLVYSDAAIVNGQTYTLTSGGTPGATIAGGLAEGGSAGATTVATGVAGQQSSSGMGGPGGGAPGGGPGGGPRPCRGVGTWRGLGGRAGRPGPAVVGGGVLLRRLSRGSRPRATAAQRHGSRGCTDNTRCAPEQDP